MRRSRRYRSGQRDAEPVDHRHAGYGPRWRMISVRATWVAGGPLDPGRLVRANVRAHRRLGCRPMDRWEADRAAMLALPPVDPVGGWRATRLPRDHYVRLDSNDNSAWGGPAGAAWVFRPASSRRRGSGWSWARRTVAEGVVGVVGLTCFGHCEANIASLLERLVSPKAWE